MNLKLHEAARLLQVDGDEVARWIRDRGLPAHVIAGQFHINSVELQEWALRHGVRLPPELQSNDLAEALRRGGVHQHVRGATRDEVLRAVVQLPGVPAEIDRELLLELLLAREMLSST